jgi:hypothetical protein
VRLVCVETFPRDRVTDPRADRLGVYGSADSEEGTMTHAEWVSIRKHLLLYAYKLNQKSMRGVDDFVQRA